MAHTAPTCVVLDRTLHNASIDHDQQEQEDAAIARSLGGGRLEQPIPS